MVPLLIYDPSVVEFCVRCGGGMAVVRHPRGCAAERVHAVACDFRGDRDLGGIGGRRFIVAAAADQDRTCLRMRRTAILGSPRSCWGAWWRPMHGREVLLNVAHGQLPIGLVVMLSAHILRRSGR